jgi:hypothetical protein
VLKRKDKDFFSIKSPAVFLPGFCVIFKRGGGAFKIVAGGWGHPPGQSAVDGVATAHNPKKGATILNVPKGGATTFL